MPFRRPARSRFSATPRRPFFRRRRVVGTRPPIMQQMQFNLQFDMFVPGITGQPLSAPTFNVQAMAPWDNISASGYDRSMMIRGIVFEFNAFMLSFDAGAGEVPGLITGVRAYMPLHSWWFIDAFDANSGAPVSYLNAPFGPFVNNPPIIAPGTALTADHSVLPQRVLKRRLMRLKVGSLGDMNDARFDAGGYTRASWAGVLRKRISIDDKQSLYWGLHAVSPYLTGTDLFVSCWLNGVLFYTIRR